MLDIKAFHQTLNTITQHVSENRFENKNCYNNRENKTNKNFFNLQIHLIDYIFELGDNLERNVN